MRRAADAEAAAGSERAGALRALPAQIEAGLDAMRAQPSAFELDILAGQLSQQRVEATAFFLRAAFGAHLDGVLAGLSERVPRAEDMQPLHEALGGEGTLSDLFDFAADTLLMNAGFALQELSSQAFGVGDPLLDQAGGEAFQEGRERAHLVDIVRGAAEAAAGLTLLAGAATLTGGGLAVGGASGGALALPAAGIVVVIDGVAVAVGGLLLLHGGAAFEPGPEAGVARDRHPVRPEHLGALAAAIGFAPDLDAFEVQLRLDRRPSEPGVGPRGFRCAFEVGEGCIGLWNCFIGFLDVFDPAGKHQGFYDPDEREYFSPPLAHRWLEESTIRVGPDTMP